MAEIGYTFIQQACKPAIFALQRPARLAPVTRVTATTDALLVPASVAPEGQDVMTHLLFALKHEGVNLQLLAQAMRHVPEATIRAAVQATPSGRYVRLAGFLWEAFNRREIADLPAIAGPVVHLFDPKRYVTTPGQRYPRWRVNFNGLGSLQYCVTVRRNATIQHCLAQDVLQQTQSFLQTLGQQTTDRALSWAYLHETESSFAIEREVPTHNKTEAFVALLRQTHEPRRMDETYLVELQNAVITNPLDQAVRFRHQQNWLRGPLRGAAGVTYIPPPPDMVSDLMHQILYFANDLPRLIDPVVAASVLSFGFVFIHPFMDGNGRLSRFLFHYALCRSGRLTQGTLLPVSVAMQRHEAAYLAALQSYSAPLRQHWSVRWQGDEDYHLTFHGDHALYRYWDATDCVAFGLAMAQQALDQDLRAETTFLSHFDQVYRWVDERFDVRGNELTTLVLSSLQHQGRVSENRRRQFRATVPEPVFAAIETACAQVRTKSV